MKICNKSKKMVKPSWFNAINNFILAVDCKTLFFSKQFDFQGEKFHYLVKTKHKSLNYDINRNILDLHPR